MSDGTPRESIETPGSPESFDRRAEVAALLEHDETALGDVWRRLRDGATPQQVADALEITLGPIYSFTGLHAALMDGTVSKAPTVAKQHAGRIRKWLKTKPLSSDLRTTRR